MIRVYVAGPYSCQNRCNYGVDLAAMQEGIDACVELLIRGYSPYCPWLDYQFRLSKRGPDINRSMFYKMGLAWLSVSNMMLVIGERPYSTGVRGEIDFAAREGIAIFYSLDSFPQRDEWGDPLIMSQNGTNRGG